MSTKRIGPFSQVWYKWKALRLPWRKRFLMGYDLEGNTYWEFRLTRGADSDGRWRRIVKYPRSAHLSSVKVSPQWHQWLRYTRQEPPSLNEQHGDVARREQMKRLAAAADARWEAKPRLTDAPSSEMEQKVPALETGGVKQDVGRAEAQAQAQAQTQTKAQAEPKVEQEKKPETVEDPWAKAKARAKGPGENWQPSAWNPAAAKKR